MAQNINTYLSNFWVPKGKPFTHTSIAGGSYAIPDTARPFFMKHYKTALLSDGAIPLHITESHQATSPILIDLDFKQSTPKRRYTPEFVADFLALYSKYVTEYVVVNGPIEYYVLEKGCTPRMTKNNVYKDGLHIIAPYVVTQPEVQESIRDKFIDDEVDFFVDLGLSNPIEDIIDAAVIFRNNWLMYGSNKPSDENVRYLATFKVTVEHDNVQVTNIDNPLNLDFVDLFSIHVHRPECTYTDVGNEQLKIRKERIKNEDAFRMSSVSCYEKRTNATFDMKVLNDVELASALVDILDAKRASNYDSWINLGICLYNIDSSNELLTKWIEFSKRAALYVNDVEAGVCQNKWSTFERRNDGLGIGTLRMWAKEDNPCEYSKIVRNNMLYFVNKASSGTHTDMANVVYNMYGNVFKCTSIKQGIWYQFKQHRWHIVEQAYTLRQLISTEVFKLFLTMSEFYQRKCEGCPDEDKCDKYLEKANTFNNLARKLKTTSFKDAIIKECAEMCFDPNFMDKLDARHELIVFENGVFDLNALRFRDGMPEDCTSFTTGYDYTDIVDKPIRDKITQFINDVMINKANAEYLLKVCAYMLHGTKFMEQFWFFTGRGRNGKGTLCSLLEKMLGNYYYEPDISIVTCVKKNSSSANPELAKSKGKRLLCASEPDDADATSKFRVNKLKQLRGNDLIQARGLFKDFIEFRPQFGMIFQMNDKPELSKADDAIGKTLKIIEFPYQFVASPSQDF